VVATASDVVAGYPLAGKLAVRAVPRPRGLLMTMNLYSHVVPELQPEAAERMDALLAP
jgi:hypothetical protein